MERFERICQSCSWVKSLEKFVRNINSKDGYSNTCLACANKVTRKKYYKQREIINKLKSFPCIDCKGIFNSWQMDFDHIPGKNKKASISQMVGEGYSNAEIQKEIDKCDLICANCHRNRTHFRKTVEYKATHFVPKSMSYGKPVDGLKDAFDNLE